ncbi:MAG: hypothetical protein ACI9SJ_001840 [Flavobacteriaceae bacterium]|uniref:GNAT family N-acetyltransferase n=1 Tax=Candidatus Marifrigoribacter sp. Uisw_064 TaxID=3230970 RepID=UPI003AE8A719
MLFYKDDKLIGLLPANIHNNIIYSHQGLSYGGLLFNTKVKFNDVFQVFNSLLIYLEKNSIKKLHLKLLPTIYSMVPSDEISYLLFKAEAQLIRKDISSVIDNSHDLKMFSSNRKRGIKKGVKNNLIVKEETGLTSFWNEILIPNLQENHKTNPVHTSSEINNLKKCFPENIKQFNVYHEDKVVAGATIFETKNVAHVQYISANNQKQQLGSLDFLFNYLVNEKYPNKKYFDFGISMENQGQQINEGLLTWKESFGARSIVHEFFEISTKNHILLNNLFL